MPDLSSKASHEFWYQYHDKMIYRVVAFMEGVETWILDGNPEFEKAMEELGQEFEDLNKMDLSKLATENLFIDVANAVGSSRTLRLLQTIDSAQPGSASKLLIYAEENSKSPSDPPGLFLRRNIVFERLRLLSRVFTKDRIKLVEKALEGEEHG